MLDCTKTQQSAAFRYSAPSPFAPGPGSSLRMMLYVDPGFPDPGFLDLFYSSSEDCRRQAESRSLDRGSRLRSNNNIFFEYAKSASHAPIFTANCQLPTDN